MQPPSSSIISYTPIPKVQSYITPIINSIPSCDRPDVLVSILKTANENCYNTYHAQLARPRIILNQSDNVEFVPSQNAKKEEAQLNIAQSDVTTPNITVVTSENRLSEEVQVETKSDRSPSVESQDAVPRVSTTTQTEALQSDATESKAIVQVNAKPVRLQVSQEIIDKANANISNANKSEGQDCEKSEEQKSSQFQDKSIKSKENEKNVKLTEASLQVQRGTSL